jgi:hypothetical protein
MNLTSAFGIRLLPCMQNISRELENASRMCNFWFTIEVYVNIKYKTIQHWSLTRLGNHSTPESSISMANTPPFICR